MMSISVKSKSKNGSEYCYHHGWYYLKGDCVAELLGELYSTLYPGTTMAVLLFGWSDPNHFDWVVAVLRSDGKTSRVPSIYLKIEIVFHLT